MKLKTLIVISIVIVVFAAVRGTELNALSGITEIHNLSAPDERILLAFQTSTRIEGSTPPSDPEELKPVMVAQYRREFNGINSREVFLISQDINFEPDSSVILEESLLGLDEVARLLKLRRINILIAGQVRLSETRAESIREELISRGISPKRLSTTGFGGSRPVGDSALVEGRALDCRVEFLVVE
jgi:outer membrane protein OmpA-like peptidoglycan-associated protein